MMFVCPATNHGAVSECGNIVNTPSLSVLSFPAVCPAPSPVATPVVGCGKLGAATVWPAQIPSAGPALSNSHIQQEIVFRQRTSWGISSLGPCPPEEGQRQSSFHAMGSQP